MDLSPGSRLGPYEIVASAGAGGMGEVYRARDTRLDRTVAVKILPVDRSGQLQLRQRFEREGKTVSSLSHPHICAVFDVGVQDDLSYLVMEYVDGQTLAQRLERGPLPIEQVLRCGVEIADALDRAHRQGIVHRDLKPANVMLTKSGVKLLDFGLAKLQQPGDESIAPLYSELATQDRPLTEDGMVLGTVQYMSPEQLEGKPVDGRTDIFALGVILYEMISGRRPFQGDSKASLISSILRAVPPPLAALQPTIPAALDHLVQKCLAKDPEQRWQSAKDVAGELEWISTASAQTQAVSGRPPRRLLAERALWIGLLVLAAAGLAALYWRTQGRAGEILKVSVLPQGRMRLTGQVAVSPDGKKLVYAATSTSGETSIWLRSFDSETARSLPGTQGVTFSIPFWSPDSRHIAFFGDGKLKRIDIVGGPAQTLAEAPAGRGGSWNQDGQIIFAPNFTGSPLQMVSAAGGPVRTVTTLDRANKEHSHIYPVFLPDGRRFLFLARGADRSKNGVFLGTLGSAERKLVLSVLDPIRFEYSAAGFLVFVKEKNLMARPFDADTLEFTGEPVAIAENVGFDGSYYSFSVSPAGLLAYTNVDLLSTQLAWVDRGGKLLAPIGQPTPCIEPFLAPDSGRVVVGCIDLKVGTTNLWQVDTRRALFSRFSFDSANNYGPVWSPDGQWIAFSSSRSGRFDLYRKVASGAGTEEVLLASERAKFSDDWSRDGRFIVFETEDPKTKYDLWILAMAGERKARPYLQTAHNEAHAQFSPDGRWMAYASDETGRAEVFVRPFPEASQGKWQISTQGGDQPSWRADGRELYYLGPDGRLLAVEIEVEPSFRAGLPQPLFQTGITPSGLIGADRNQYVPAPDGQRFLINSLPEGALYSPVQVIFNWTELMR